MDRVASMSAFRHRQGQRQISLGVDVGGTWLRIVASENGRVGTPIILRAARDLSALPRLLRAAWRRRGWNRRHVASLVVASRGLWTARERRALAHRLRALARRVRVVSDAQAALLGALGNRPGVLLLSGTGSIVVGCDARGRWARAGGLGPLVGDEGSGFWIGREWLRATAGAGNLLRTLRVVHAPDPVSTIAALAPGVFARARRGDRRALTIARAGQAHLAAGALEVTRALRLSQPVDASWAGSVLDDPWFRAGVVRAVARAGLRVRWHRPATEPVAAAARLAEKLGRA